ncbi:MAG: ABC transporter ATP-binding protein [Planctomycetaceae bacterium]|nr:ABC transporter ATP-binding protein [Planctomycetaceae bacterium]
MENENRLEVRNLSVAFRLNDRREALAVDSVSFHVGHGETLALVGESGCGKSVTCLALMRLLPIPPARIVGGEACLSGRELLGLPESDMRAVRGTAMSMIFQEPMTSFDPVYTIGDQLAEAILAHERRADPEAVTERVADAMASVGLPDPKNLMRRYPHELSGGMKQRAMIAMALLGNPEILLCDEPTTALDVTIQAQIMDLLADIREKRGMSMLFITHNLGLVAELARRAAVMYAGRIIETATVADLFHEPLHPYSAGLLASIPRLEARVDKLQTIPGSVPGLADRPPGCKFAPRCDFAEAVCREVDPPLADRGGRLCACHFPGIALGRGGVRGFDAAGDNASGGSDGSGDGVGGTAVPDSVGDSAGPVSYGSVLTTIPPARLWSGPAVE